MKKLPEGPRTCSACGLLKDAKWFFADRSQCKACRAKYQRERYAKNPDVRAWHQRHREGAREEYEAYHEDYYQRNKARIAERNRAKKYGLRPGQLEQMLKYQGGCCAVCQEPLRPGRGTNVDHCHASGRVRSLLCKSCNILLGEARDSPVLLRAAAEYLEKHETRATLPEAEGGAGCRACPPPLPAPPQP